MAVRCGTTVWTYPDVSLAVSRFSGSMILRPKRSSVSCQRIARFCPDTVSAALDGNKRYPRGIEYVAVNGRVVVDCGRYEGAMAGRVIRKGSAGGPVSRREGSQRLS